MIKTFFITKYKDESWTGGRAGFIDGWKDILDEEINNFELGLNVTIEKIEHSVINENIQHGYHTNNTSRNIIHIATVYYQEKMSFFEKFKFLFKA